MAAEPKPQFEPLRAALLGWFETNRRSMPARETRDPWRLLVLEVMSQQTQIERAAAASLDFCERFPTPETLAAAAPGDAVRAWSGLGYNRRAVALWRAAATIVAEHGGRVPETVEALDALPGVGAYTARAVAAHAFGVPVAPVDVNVARVVGRLRGEPAAAQRRSALQADADALVDPADPSRSIHALMDLSAAVCRRRDPACGDCPLAFGCASAFRVESTARDAGGAGGAAASATAAASVPFPRTRRWLRGELLRRLVAAAPDGWSSLGEEAVGAHTVHAVREALAGLAADGLVELDDAGRARLPRTPSAG